MCYNNNMKDDNQTETENLKKGLQKRREPEMRKTGAAAHSNPVVKKFVEFTRSKYKFSIKDFYFK